MAAPEVGGRYHVERHRGDWIVDHEGRDAAGRWRRRRIGSWVTLEDAKAAAEADNQARAQERHHQSRPRP